MRATRYLYLRHEPACVNRHRKSGIKIMQLERRTLGAVAEAILGSEGRLRGVTKAQFSAFVNMLAGRTEHGGLAEITSEEISVWMGAKREREQGEAATARLLSI